MALYELKEFADRCGVKKSYVQEYIRRKKVIQRADGLMDDQDEKNALFLATRKKGQVDDPPADPVGDQPAVAASKPSERPVNQLTELERKKKESDLALNEQKLRIEKIREQKLTGEVVPTDMVKMTFARHTKHIVQTFHQGAENLITKMTKKKGLTPEEVAEMRHELVDIINKATEDAISMSLNDVDHIQAEYAQNRERGERKV